MPADAAPQPWPTHPAGTVHHRREYRDPLRRPLRGTLTYTGAQRAETDAAVVVSAPVNVALEDGVVDVHLPPGTYKVTGQLQTADGVRIREDTTVELG